MLLLFKSPEHTKPITHLMLSRLEMPFPGYPLAGPSFLFMFRLRGRLTAQPPFSHLISCHLISMWGGNSGVCLVL